MNKLLNGKGQLKAKQSSLFNREPSCCTLMYRSMMVLLPGTRKLTMPELGGNIESRLVDVST